MRTVSLERCHDGGPIDGHVDCGNASRHELDGMRTKIASWTRAQHLCWGMRMLQDASCEQLSNTSYLQEVIQTTGITFDQRKHFLYGDAAKYMIRTSTGQKIGLWQDPSQFAAAMAYHGSSRHEIRNYIEVGCYTGCDTTTCNSPVHRTTTDARTPTAHCLHTDRTPTA